MPYQPIKFYQAGSFVAGNRLLSDDERSVQITLTQQGAELRERARAIPVVIARVAGLTAEETEEAKSFLERLTANVSAR